MARPWCLPKLMVMALVVATEFSTGVRWALCIAAEFAEEIHITFQSLVLGQLRNEHIGGGLHVGQSVVRATVFLAQVVAHGRTEVARLHLMVDACHIHDVGFGSVPCAAHTRQFLGKERHIEAHAIETAQVATAQPVVDGTGQRFQRWCTGHILIADAMDARGIRRNGHARVDEAFPSFATAIRMERYDADLHDAVLAYAQPCGFQVEEGEGP